MAEVFLAAHRGPLGFEKLVVIKRLKPGIATEPDVNAMFLDEARLAARLNHPNVVQTYECGQVDEQYYIVMEYLEGQSLDRICRRLDPSRYRSAYLAIVSDALAGLHHAHDLVDFNGMPLQVVHRDISPHNIFVTYDGQAKVVDFGIAKWATRDADTSTGVVKGKIRYMAPEQALAATVDRRADVFAMGLIFWELIVGERFWGDLSDVQILQRLTFGEIPRLRERWPAAPEALDRICSRALSMQPDGRYATAALMRDDIEGYLGTLGRRPTSAEIGRLVAEAFAHRRAEVKAAISEQLGRLHAQAEVEEEVEVLPVLEDRGAGPWSQAQALQPSHVRAAAAGSTTPHPTQSPLATPIPTTPVPAPSREQPSWDDLSTRKTIPTIASDAALQARMSKRRAVAVAATLLLGVGVAGAWMIKSSSKAPEQDFAHVAPGVEPGRLIELQIIATPPDAKIYLDDVAVPQNPFFARFERDGTGHRVRVTAEGYAPEARLIVFTRDQVLTINLRPLEKKNERDQAASSTRSGDRPAPAGGRQDAAPAPTRKLPLDTESPWR